MTYSFIIEGVHPGNEGRRDLADRAETALSVRASEDDRVKPKDSRGEVRALYGVLAARREGDLAVLTGCLEAAVRDLGLELAWPGILAELGLDALAAEHRARLERLEPLDIEPD